MQNTPETVQSAPIESISTPETSNVTPDVTRVTPDVTNSEPSYELKSESQEDDVPEWGKKDPTKFVQYRLGRQKEKFSKEIMDLKRQLEEQNSLISRMTAPQNYQENQYQQNSQPSGQPIVDPLTGEYVAPGSVRAELILREQQRAYMEKMQYESHIKAEQERAQQEETERFLEKLEDAKSKYSDYDKVVNSVEITSSILETAKLLPNGPDLLYYLAKNPKEVSRIVKMPPYLQAKEMVKHAMGLQTHSVSKAPAPVPQLDSGDKPEVKPNLRNMSASQLSAYFREKNKARYKR